MLTANEIKIYSSLKVKKYRDDFNKFIVEGYKQVSEGLASGLKCEIVIYHHEIFYEISDIISQAMKKGVRYEAVKSSELHRMSDTINSQGLVAVFRVPTPIKTDKTAPVIVYLDRISDPGNMGTILRTADWFGFREILLSTGCVDIYNPKTVRSTMGSIFRGSFHHECDEKNLKILKEAGYRIVTTQLNGKELKKYSPSPKTVIVLSNESHGVLPGLASIADDTIKIPGVPGAESLNVAVAAGIILNKFFETGNNTR